MAATGSWRPRGIAALAGGFALACSSATIADKAPAGPLVDDPEAPVDSGLGADTSAAPACTEVLAIDPTDGTESAFYRGLIRVDLSEDGRELLEVELRDAQGADLQGTVVRWSDDGTRALIGGPVPLEPSMLHTLRLSTDCGDVQTTFVTSASGQAIATASVPVRGYLVDARKVRSLVPALDDRALRLAAASLDAYAIRIEAWSPSARVYGASFLALPPHPDLGHACDRRVVVGGDLGWPLTENPFLRIDRSGVETILPMAWAGPLGLAAAALDQPIDHRASVHVLRFALSAAVSPDRQTLDGMRITTTVDARTIATEIQDQGLRASAGELCTDVAAMGATCEPCADGARYCVTADLDGLVAVQDDTIPTVVDDDCAVSF